MIYKLERSTGWVRTFPVDRTAEFDAASLRRRSWRSGGCRGRWRRSTRLLEKKLLRLRESRIRQATRIRSRLQSRHLKALNHLLEGNGFAGGRHWHGTRSLQTRRPKWLLGIQVHEFFRIVERRWSLPFGNGPHQLRSDQHQKFCIVFLKGSRSKDFTQNWNVAKEGNLVRCFRQPPVQQTADGKALSGGQFNV